MAIVYKGIETAIAHTVGVVAEVRAKASEIKTTADSLFARHNRPGGHEIEIEHGNPDSLVSLTGPSPLSVEYGRAADASGKGRMEGLHILGRAANL